MRCANARRPLELLALLAGVIGCGGDTTVAPIDTGATISDVRIDVLGARDFTAAGPWPPVDLAITVPAVLVDSAQGSRYSFPVTVRTPDQCDTLLLQPEGASRYFGFAMTPVSQAVTQIITVTPRRVVGATPRAARMKIAIACAGKISQPVTVPVPFF